MGKETSNRKKGNRGQGRIVACLLKTNVDPSVFFGKKNVNLVSPIKPDLTYNKTAIG